MTDSPKPAQLRVSPGLAQLFHACLHWRRMHTAAYRVPHPTLADQVQAVGDLVAAEHRLSAAVQAYFTGDRVSGRDVVADPGVDV